MFWRFGGYSNISTIDTLLDKDEVTLEELLDESDLIQELKSHNTKLIEYLRDDSTLERLLKYVVAPGTPVEEDEDLEEDLKGKGKAPEFRAEEERRREVEEREKAEKQRLKYAYVACEILSCETWSITEALMANVPHLTEFWDFLKRPAPLDPLQAGYFTKVNETLLDKKTEDMLEFFKTLPGIVPVILQHVDCPMVMDLLLKIISLEKAEGGQGIVDWLYSQDLVPTLLSYLSPACNASTQTSAGDFLKAIITISANAAQNEQSCIGPNSLTRQLVSESCMKSLIESMLQGGNALTVGVGIVIEVIRKNNSDYDPENGHNPDTPPTNHDPIYLGTLLRMFANHVPDFMNLILSSKHAVVHGDTIKLVERGQLSSAWGTRIEPLGFDRFKTCELMAELLHCSNMGLLNERGSEEYIKERDVERERLRLQGAFSQKPSEGSIADVSNSSSRFENGFVSSAGNSMEELRIANSSEEDGFEKVAVSDATDDREALPSVPVVSLVDQEDLMDAQTSNTSVDPAERAGNKDEIQGDAGAIAIQTLSPTTAHLDDGVRRLSLEDVPMTSPPNETNEPATVTEELNSSPISPHPEDKPAPLFSKPSDPNKTPTPTSPNFPLTPKSPKSPKRFSQDVSLISQMEGDTSFESVEESTQTFQQADSLQDRPVVGDYLKIMFIQHQVVPTILDFFFRFPWNNFLHNVVYDVVQQVFNGPMERGHNRYLAFDLFETGKITERIIQGQTASDEAQETKNMRLGYMGHLTLVAEEVVKFGERHPKELLSPKVQEYVYGKPWEEYVTKTLAETRERDNAILGGFRPDTGLGPRQAVLNAVSGGSNALANLGLGGGFQQGLDSIDLSNNGSATSGVASGGGSLLSGFANSSDDEDEDMEDGDDNDQHRATFQLSMLNSTENESDTQPIPLIPPPPAPLKIKPSQARQRLERRLAMQKQQAEEEAAAASEFGAAGDDPFASLGDDDDDDDQDTADPFSLDEEEQDITSFGNRNKSPFHITSTDNHTFSVSRGLSSLFSSSSTAHEEHEPPDSFDASLDDSSTSSSNSDIDPLHPPLEAMRSNERKPLDIDDEDEEMGEMVGPTTEETFHSSDDELTSATSTAGDLHKTDGHVRRHSRVEEMEEPVSEFDGQQDRSASSSSDEEVVEISLPHARKGSRG